MSTQSKMRITVPAQAVRLTWEGLSDTSFSNDEIWEIVQRYCDSQDHAKTYRVKAALRTKLIRNAVQDLAKASGLSVEEYLELEATNLKGE